MRFRWLALILLPLFLIGSTLVFILPKKVARSTKALGHLSLEDRRYLTIFLRSILFADSFAYLLFGSKSVAITNFDKFFPFAFSRHFAAKSDFDINKGLEVFRKNEHLFSSENIIVCFDEDAELIDLLMINKKNLLRTLEEHIEDFRQVLGPGTTTKSLFTQITTTSGIYDLLKIIDHHDALFGILLGYGRDNAWLFNEKSTISEKLNEFRPPLKRDSSLEKKLAEIVQKTTPFNDVPREWKYVLQCPRIPLPQFMADLNSQETKMLKERYNKEREGLYKIFARQGLVEATFEQLMD